MYVSKVFAVDRDALPQRRAHKVVRRQYIRRDASKGNNSSENSTDTSTEEPKIVRPNSSANSVDDSGESNGVDDEAVDDPNDDRLFICFARVLSGTLRPGQQVRVLGPKQNDLEDSMDEHSSIGTSKTTNIFQRFTSNVSRGFLVFGDSLFSTTHWVVSNLYLLMGRQLEPLYEAPAGAVVGIGGLSKHVLKTALLTDVGRRCPPLAKSAAEQRGLLRVAIEPTHAREQTALMRGLALLEQADAAVDVAVLETGETVLACAGELHLSRCLADLRDRFAAGIAFSASAPLVALRESVSNVARRAETSVVQHTAGRLLSVRVDCVRVPDAIAASVEAHEPIWRRLYVPGAQRSLTGAARRAAAAAALAALERAFASVPEWAPLLERVWALGPKRTGSCLFVNALAWQSAADVRRFSALGLLRRAAALDDASESDVGKWLSAEADADADADSGAAVAPDEAAQFDSVVERMLRVGAVAEFEDDDAKEAAEAEAAESDESSEEEIDDGDTWVSFCCFSFYVLRFTFRLRNSGVV